MGHEFAGEVVKLGENVKDIQIGDKVCGINVSLDISEGELDGLGIFQDGGFAEYVKVPMKYLFKIPQNISTKEAVMIESFANAVRGTKLSKISENENIVIIGGGNIGLCFLKYLKITRRPNYIIVVEPQKYLQDKAIFLGASEAFPPSPAKIKKYFKKYGKPSFIFDCAGNEKSILMAIDLIKKGGTILLEGVYKGKVTFPMFLMNSKEICFKGVLGHDREDILNSIEFFAQNDINANQYVTEIMPLSDIQKAFERYLSSSERDFIKIAIKP